MRFADEMMAARTSSRAIDLGLRDYMLRVYQYMSLGLGLTGAVAFYVSTSPQLLHLVLGTPLSYVLMFATLGLVFALSSSAHRMQPSVAQGLFWLYAGMVGMSLAPIFLLYTGTSVARVFLISASIFGSMSIYGHTTGRDLTSMGAFLFMGLLGIVIASLVNLFLKSTGLQMLVSFAGVLIFTALTAYDTQRIKETYYYQRSTGGQVQTATAVVGALTLYLNFLNLFLSLIQILGVRRSND